MEQSRRDVLRAGAGLASAGALSGLAGCGILPGGGGGGGGGGLLGGGGGAFYSSWMVEPDAIDEEDHYFFSAGKPSQMAGNDEFSDTDGFESLEDSTESSSRFGPTDISFSSINQFVSLGSGTVQIVTGSFTVEDVAGELDDDDYDEEDELDSGERVFLNGEAGSAFAVSSNHIIGAFGSNASMSSPEGPEQPNEGEGEEDIRSIAMDETVTSTITTSDPEVDYSDEFSGNYYEPITFTGSPGQEINIQATTDDNYDYVNLALEDPDGEYITEYSYSSEIDATLESSGEYTIYVSTWDVDDYSYYGDESLTYSLSLTLLYDPESLVDTVGSVAGIQNDNTESYTSAVDSAQPLFDALGGGVYVYGSTYEQLEEDNPESGQLEDSVAQGLSFSFGDGQFNVTGAVVYDSESDADTGDVEDWADEGTLAANGDIDDISTSQNGRTVTFSGVCDYDELFEN